MITAIHTLVYSDDPDATRAFLRDVLGWPYVEHPESSPGWLIFKTGPSELGVHPTWGTHEGQDVQADFCLLLVRIEPGKRASCAEAGVIDEQLEGIVSCHVLFHST